MRRLVTLFQARQPRQVLPAVLLILLRIPQMVKASFKRRMAFQQLQKALKRHQAMLMRPRMSQMEARLLFKRRQMFQWLRRALKLHRALRTVTLRPPHLLLSPLAARRA